MKFLGHIIDEKGGRPDPERVAALQNINTPKDISQLRRFTGMANQLSKFTPKLFSLSQPLKELLSLKKPWH